MSSAARPLRIAILGAGFGGLGAAIKLREAGFDDWTILERGADLGGTWRDNTYPGCACDIPAPLYSFSFESNPAWTRLYSTQAEIWDYLRRLADKHHLRERIRFGTKVVEARWDDGWHLRFADGREERFDAVVCAVGFLNRPNLPRLAGLEGFPGIAFHSAQWRHDVDLAGRRVAVIGTGASAIQFMPEIAPRAASVTVWQRTPPWVMPRIDRSFSAREQRAFRRFPFLRRLLRWRIYLRQELLVSGFLGGAFIQKQFRAFGERQIAHQVRDPVLRAKLVPDYAPGCKRILVSNDWYPALQRSNVELVAEGAARIEGSRVVGASGTAREADVIIFGTGFSAIGFPSPLRVLGRGGRELAEAWRDGAATHLGISVSGFPNLFFLVGPNTGLGHNSIVFMIEAQLRYIVQALARLRVADARTLELRPEAQATSYAEVQARMRRTVWLSGCRSWYLTPDGRNDTLWPGSTLDYWWRTRRFDPAAYAVA
ncbi:MAG: flavin-containing monooxygenase [Burkholderiales bacterium]